MSPQTAYLWVERKQIPHLRVMGRNIRFLKSDLNKDGAVYRRRDTNFWWMRYKDRAGILRKESSGVQDWQAAQRKLRDRLQARDGNVLDIVRRDEAIKFGQWTDFYLENYSKPPIRELKTHAADLRATKHLRTTFGTRRLIDMAADDIELFLRERLRQRVRTKANDGYHERGPVKPATVHQELRVLRRMLNVAVRKKLLPSNPCSSVEFPVAVKRLFKPHYVTWSEQQRIERHSPQFLRNVVRILTETGLRINKELLSMKKEQVDIANATTWIPDSENGVAEVPLTPFAVDAFRNQLSLAAPSDWLFPSARTTGQRYKSVKGIWRAALRKAGIAYFRPAVLPTNGLSNCCDKGAPTYSKYSQMKLAMKREALEQLNRRANEMDVGEAQTGPVYRGFGSVLVQ